MTDFVPVEVFVKSGKSGTTIDGPFAANIIDFSLTGASLLMSRIKTETCHVYHSPRQDKSLQLEIVFNRPPRCVNVSIPASPVWMNTFESDEFRERIIGIKFLDSGDREEASSIRQVLENI